MGGHRPALGSTERCPDRPKDARRVGAGGEHLLRPDRRRRDLLTAGGSDELAKLWDTKTLQQFGSTFPGDPGQWGNAEFTPDASKLVVVYADGTGFSWPISVKAWEKHACRVAGRNFTAEEWRGSSAVAASRACVPRPRRAPTRRRARSSAARIVHELADEDRRVALGVARRLACRAGAASGA